MMRLVDSFFVVVATACVSAFGVLVVAATNTAALQVFEFTVGICLVAFLFRKNRHALVTFETAAGVIAVNQILLAHGYVTFLNAGQVMSGLGPFAGGIVTAVVLACLTVAGFYPRRLWAYVAVGGVLIALTWPTTISGLSI